MPFPPMSGRRTEHRNDEPDRQPAYLRRPSGDRSPIHRQRATGAARRQNGMVIPVTQI